MNYNNLFQNVDLILTNTLKQQSFPNFCIVPHLLD